MKIQPVLFNLNDLLSNRLFRIPEYQRAYSWEAKHRKDLFSDIERIRTSGEDHFMATVVGLEQEKVKIAADEFTMIDLVDGQQRLTTLIILLKAIQLTLDPNERDHAKLAEWFASLLVKTDDFSLLLLQTNHDTSRIFADFIREGIVPAEPAFTSADKNIVDAINETLAFAQEWQDRAKGGLVELVSVLRYRLWTIFHSVDDEGVVYRVFEVLNSRGLDVSWIDKLKSQLMALVYEQGSKRAQREAIQELHLIWQDIYRTIGLDKHLSSETLRFAGTLKAQTEQSRLLNEERSVETLIALCGNKPKGVVKCARWVEAIVNAEAKIVRDHRLRAVTRIVQARLVAVAVLLSDFPARDKSEILALWERVTFRIYGLNGSDARTKVGDYTRLAWRILHKDLSPADTLRELAEMGREYPINQVLERFDKKDCYNGWSEELRYFFFRYDEHLAKKAGQKLNEAQWNKIWAAETSRSIEHIKPQSSEVSYLHLLGNLMMLPPGVNSSLQAKDPSVKAETYKTCGLLSTVEVAKLLKQRRWSRKTVEKRGKKLIAWARNEWRG